MMILLDEKESAAYLKTREREAILEYTSRFPPSMQKTKPLPLTDAGRAAIIELYDDGCGLSEISEILNLPIAQIRGAIGAYCVKKARQVPVGEVPLTEVAVPRERPESVSAARTSKQDRIDEMILAGVARGQNYTTIAADINNAVGGYILSDHVGQRLAELRGGKS